MVRSNRESGKSRPDVLIVPRRTGDPGVVVELKVARPGKKTMDQGFAQIAANDYLAELRAAGTAPARALVVAFDGKDMRVRSAEPLGHE